MYTQPITPKGIHQERLRRVRDLVEKSVCEINNILSVLYKPGKEIFIPREVFPTDNAVIQEILSKFRLAGWTIRPIVNTMVHGYYFTTTWSE